MIDSTNKPLLVSMELHADKNYYGEKMASLATEFDKPNSM